MQRSEKKILIADDHLLVRGGLELICKQNFQDYTLHFASNFEEVIEKIKTISCFDLLILDIQLDTDNSLLHIDEITSIQENIPILIYTGVDENLLTRLKGFNIKGVLSKMADEEEIVTAIKQVLERKEQFESRDVDDQEETSPILLLKKLSTRELEVMKLSMKGYGNLEISNELDIQSNTISTYKKRILEKLKVRDFTELMRLYKIYFSDK